MTPADFERAREYAKSYIKDWPGLAHTNLMHISHCFLALAEQNERMRKALHPGPAPAPTTCCVYDTCSACAWTARAQKYESITGLRVDGGEK